LPALPISSKQSGRQGEKLENGAWRITPRQVSAILACNLLILLRIIGMPGGIRTLDHPIKSRMLYL
jgi:hypothetical protein